MISDHLNT